MKKRILQTLTCLLLVAITGTMLTACVKIDGVRWSATKAIFNATLTAGGDTETKNDDVYSVKMSITYTIGVTEEKTVLVEKIHFVLSQSVVGWYMHDSILNNVTHTPKEVIEVSGSGSGTTLNYVKLEIDFGDEITHKQLEALQKKFTIKYKDTNIKLPKAISYK